jgi:hypothetical protein
MSSRSGPKLFQFMVVVTALALIAAALAIWLLTDQLSEEALGEVPSARTGSASVPGASRSSPHPPRAEDDPPPLPPLTSGPTAPSPTQPPLTARASPATKPALAGPDASPEQTGESPHAEDPSPQDLARFTVRWDSPALCIEKQRGRDELIAERAALLKTFSTTRDLRHAPSVPPMLLTLISVSLERAAERATEALGPASIPVPEVFVYADREQLTRHACITADALGYYDGAIHLAADLDADRTTIHEYVHHVLRSRGIQQPTWLHEGLAMHLAREDDTISPAQLRWVRDNHLPFEVMGQAFPHGSDQRFAVATYVQSYAMVSLIEARRTRAGWRWLVEQLATKQLSPEDAFTEGVGLKGDALEDAWKKHLEPR